jgi:hypothetical protein
MAFAEVGELVEGAGVFADFDHVDAQGIEDVGLLAHGVGSAAPAGDAVAGEHHRLFKAAGLLLDERVDRFQEECRRRAACSARGQSRPASRRSAGGDGRGDGSTSSLPRSWSPIRREDCGSGGVAGGPGRVGGDRAFDCRGLIVQGSVGEDGHSRPGTQGRSNE